MSVLFYGNFDFEHRLSRAGARESLPAPLRRLNAELACAWAAIAADGDQVRLPAPIERDFFESVAAQGLPRMHPVFDDDPPGRTAPPEAVWPWGWTEEVRTWADGRGYPFAAPPQLVVARANSRAFSAELEREFDVAVPGAAVIRSEDDLNAALTGLPAGHDRWVVKGEFGMSARERMIGQGRLPDRRIADWIRLRIARDGAVYFEPWLERVEETGLHFTVRPDAPPVFEGLAPMLSDPWGRYLGSRFELDPDLETRWTPAIHVGMRVAARLGRIGYFGPLGIDACRWRDADGLVRLRPVQDINARFTMGGLAQGFRRLLRPGEAGTWLHVRWPCDSPDAPRRWFEQLRQALPPGVRALRTSPFEADGLQVARGTLVLLAGSRASCTVAESQALETGR